MQRPALEMLLNNECEKTLKETIVACFEVFYTLCHDHKQRNILHQRLTFFQEYR
jgi:hypothetical protein